MKILVVQKLLCLWNSVFAHQIIWVFLAKNVLQVTIDRLLVHMEVSVYHVNVIITQISVIKLLENVSDVETILLGTIAKDVKLGFMEMQHMAVLMIA
uniref:Putative secreted protein n=1 Tax=Panstrongylus lignarius TaxID=156445 RepID=A0A224XUZ4_9HEMI